MVKMLLLLDVIALIDSGADITVIPRGLADFLCLDLKGKTNISNGIGGEVKVKDTKVTIQISKGHERYNFRIPIQVIMGPDEVPPLLGRNNFFDKFIISFDNRNERITLKRNIQKKY